MAQLLQIIHKGNNSKKRKHWVNVNYNASDHIYISILNNIPDFIKLVAIGWIWRFSTQVIGVEAAEESV